jgi:hypothetical protein
MLNLRNFYFKLQKSSWMDGRAISPFWTVLMVENIYFIFYFSNWIRFDLHDHNLVQLDMFVIAAFKGMGVKNHHKIIVHHHRYVPDNGASLNPRECWTMLLECHSDLTYVGPISVHQNACNMWSDTVLLNSDDVFELIEITCCCMISSRYSTSFIYFPLTVTRDVCSFMSSNPITHHHAASIKLYARQ